MQPPLANDPVTPATISTPAPEATVLAATAPKTDAPAAAPAPIDLATPAATATPTPPADSTAAAETAKEAGAATPPPPPSKAAGSKNMMVLGIVAAVAILLGGVAAYNAILQSKSHVAAMNYGPNNSSSVAQASTSPTPQPASGQIDPKNTSDQSLEQDEQTINSQVTQATADLNDTDKSLNDQPDNLAQ
jgi:hypothetical protein